MKRIGTKVVSLEEFGYDEPVVFKELTLRDMSEMAQENNLKMKNEGFVSQADSNMILLKHLIKSAPFPVDIEHIGDVPLSVAVYLIEEAGEMLTPLATKKQDSSNTITEEDVLLAAKSQDESTATNSSDAASPVSK